MTVLYATEGGNSEKVAAQFVERLKTDGIEVERHNLDSYSIRSLKKVRYALIVTSTHGEGAPPDTAATFFEDLQSRKAPKLQGLNFAVLALGDSSYERFCEAGKLVDRRLEELGATRLHARVDCDVEFEEPTSDWIEKVQLKLAEIAELKSTQDSPDRGSSSGELFGFGASEQKEVVPQKFDRTTPFLAHVIDSAAVTGRGSSKQVRHIELSLGDSGISYAPGDALGVIPQNRPQDVERVPAHRRSE